VQALNWKRAYDDRLVRTYVGKVSQVAARVLALAAVELVINGALVRPVAQLTRARWL
jgi:hypothetical protein